MRVLFSDKVFSITKPLELLIDLIRVGFGNDKVGIVLYFYAVSSTYVQALINVNAEAGEKRKFIMVQLPESLDEADPDERIAYNFLKNRNKAPNLSEISLERIRRAGDKVMNETGIRDLDIGFKAFKLDTSNVKLWDPSNIEN